MLEGMKSFPVLPVALVAGVALVALSSRRREGAPSAPSTGSTPCDLAIDNGMGAVERYFGGDTGRESTAKFAFARAAVQRACPVEVLSTKSPACHATIARVNQGLLANPTGDKHGELLAELYGACPCLFDDDGMVVTLHLPDGTRDARVKPTTAKALEALLEELVRANEAWLRANPRAPNLYDAGVRYGLEAIGEDEFNAIPFVLSSRVGDCEDLASWRAAELRVRSGVAAKARVTSTPFTQGGRAIDLFHVTVQYPDGRIEDPSERLGMRDVTIGRAST